MKKFRTILLACLLLTVVFPITARADMGPKPSVNLIFSGFEGQTYYGTLLYEHSSTGPASAWDGTPEAAARQPGDEDYSVWQAFVEYPDSDGYYFLQRWWDCSETHTLRWSYYPPEVFKILLYFPEHDSFLVSSVYERYAFDTYYAVELAGDGVLTAKRTYDYTWELVSLAARIVLTIGAELAVAWLCGFREKSLLQFFAVVNVITQVALNVLLNLLNYHGGSFWFTVVYSLLELVVIVAETKLYVNFIQAYSQEEQQRDWNIFYGIVANIVSFVVGLILAHVIPGIF